MKTRKTIAELNDLWWEEEGISTEACPICVVDLVREVLGEFGIKVVASSRLITPDRDVGAFVSDGRRKRPVEQFN